MFVMNVIVLLDLHYRRISKNFILLLRRLYKTLVQPKWRVLLHVGFALHSAL